MTNSKRPKNPDTPEVRSKYYLTNDRLLPAVVKARSQGKVTNELAEMLMLLAKKYAQRPIFTNYTYKDDMISEALVNLCHNALKFDPDRSQNPFAFFTTCIHRSFLHVLSVEKRHRRLRDQMLVEIGENPSFNFSEEYARLQLTDIGEDMSNLRDEIEEAKSRMSQEMIEQLAADAKAAEEAAAAALLLSEEETILLVFDDVPNQITLDEDSTKL